MSDSFFAVLFRKPFTFQKLTFIIGLIILIGMVILVSYSFYVLNKNRVFPPNIPECPDYFEVTGENMCFNSKNIGRCGKETTDFNSDKYKGFNGLKEKLGWANNCEVVWDGITNNSELTKM